MNTDLDTWLKAGQYLPPPLRDFHDQKDVFKTIHRMVAVDKNDYAKHINWVAGQCYVIDIFLWFMAKRGWTLQRSRSSLEFRDLGQDVGSVKEEEGRIFAEMLASRSASGTPVDEDAAQQADDGYRSSMETAGF